MLFRAGESFREKTGEFQKEGIATEFGEPDVAKELLANPIRKNNPRDNGLHGANTVNGSKQIDFDFEINHIETEELLLWRCVVKGLF